MMADPLQANIVIVGAGVAGMLAAYKLAQAGAILVDALAWQTLSFTTQLTICGVPDF
jgi:ribulose 1,5-bisphosphate synthetase/thiazole synthase